uniref:Uncharacterized protein n=1 Tax=Romanomermis culicivorax TaxID=13658 RepID=A0A915L459_ROMCU
MSGMDIVYLQVTKINQSRRRFAWTTWINGAFLRRKLPLKAVALADVMVIRRSTNDLKTEPSSDLG